MNDFCWTGQKQAPPNDKKWRAQERARRRRKEVLSAFSVRESAESAKMGVLWEEEKMTRIPRIRSLALLALLAVPMQLLAQEPQIGSLYKCANGQSGLKVTKCSGGSPDVCDVELYRDGKVLNTV